MNQHALQDILSLTQQCLTRYWKRDCEFMLRFFDKEIIWVGVIGHQFMHGLEEAAQELRNSMKEIPRCYLLKREFWVVQNCGNACTIVGRYVTTTTEEAGYFMQAQQRCSFTWEIVKGKPVLKHCHISNPMEKLNRKKNERFPLATGEMARRYQRQWLNKKQENRRIVITDKNEVVHFLTPSEVIYVRADRRNSLIYTATGEETQGRMSIRDFLKAAGDDFHMVHRSFVLNEGYIMRIQKYEVIMADGTAIPVPEKRYRKIREELIGLYEVEEE